MADFVESGSHYYHGPGLNNLPAEVYRKILSHFPLDFPEIDWPTPRLNDAAICQDLSLWEGRYVENLQVYGKLRLVSASVQNAVMPLLLRSVIITNPRQFVRFYRLILSTPEWGEHVRNLAVLVTLNRGEVAHEIVRWIVEEFEGPVDEYAASTCEWSVDKLTQLAKHMGLPIPEDSNGRPATTTADLAEGMLSDLLLHTPNLIELALQMPYRSNMNATPGRSPWPMLYTRIKDHPKPPKIQKLQLRPDPNEFLQSRQWTARELYNFDLMRHYKLLASFPTLHTLKVASNYSSTASLPSLFYPCRNTSVCWMHQTTMGPRAITRLLSPQVTPVLKKLTVTQRPRHYMTRNRSNEIQVATLDDALKARADELKALHLIFDFTDGGESNLCYVGARHRISNLSTLHALTSLTIQMQLLLGNPDCLKLRPDLAQILPPNLETLVIRDEWAIDTVAREQVRQRNLGCPSDWRVRNIHAYGQITSTEIDLYDPVPGLFARTDSDYYNGYHRHESYRQCVRDMLFKLSDARQEKNALPYLRKFSYQVLTTKPWLIGGTIGNPNPTQEPMVEDLFRNYHLLFKFIPPRWLPHYIDRVQPAADWALMHILRAHFGDINGAFARGGVAFDWAGDAREWLELLREAAIHEEEAFEQAGEIAQVDRSWHETVEEMFTFKEGSFDHDDDDNE